MYLAWVEDVCVGQECVKSCAGASRIAAACSPATKWRLRGGAVSSDKVLFLPEQATFRRASQVLPLWKPS